MSTVVDSSVLRVIVVAEFLQRLYEHLRAWPHDSTLPVLQAMMAHSVRLLLETQRYWARIMAGLDVCHGGCAYTKIQTVQRPGVCRVYGALHCQEPLK